MGCIIYSPLWLRMFHSLVGRGNYICIYVGLSALLVSADRAMREPLHSGTSDRLAPRFLYMLKNLIIMPLGVKWFVLKFIKYESDKLFEALFYCSFFGFSLCELLGDSRIFAFAVVFLANNYVLDCNCLLLPPPHLGN